VLLIGVLPDRRFPWNNHSEEENPIMTPEGRTQVTQPEQPGVVDKIVKGLSEQPAYLLIFGICLLALGGGGVSGILGLKLSSQPAIWAGAIVCVVAIAAGVVVVIKVESLGRAVPQGAVGDAELAPIFDAVHRNIASALRFSHPVFHDWIRDECARFQEATSHWSRGELSTSQRRYNQLLLLVYETASKSVTATSTPNYLETWRSPLGEEILRAHERSKIGNVERIFIFDSFADVSPEDIEVMKRQQAGDRIKARVWGNKEDVTYDLPKDVNPNFAIIDEGDVIAVSAQGESGATQGTFYFKDVDKKQTYAAIMANLRNGSMPFEEFLARRENKGVALGVLKAQA
jgi:hypothetical protein